MEIINWLPASRDGCGNKMGAAMSDLRHYLRRLQLAVTCLPVLFCTLTACVPATLPFSGAAVQAKTIAHLTPTTCRFPLSDERPVDCFDLEVPEDYEDIQGRRIRLHVALVHSSSETPAPDPLIILYGGPGAYTLDRLEKTIDRFAGVLDTRDIILYDQRGVGYSQPSLNCPEVDDVDVMVIDEQWDDGQAFEQRLAAYRSCRDRLETSGTDLQAYSAGALAADLASLRQVFGCEEWNLYGVSYGARQALVLMRDYPDGLRSVILDSVYPVDIDLARETAVTSAYALDMLFAANEVAHPAFEQAFFSLANELDTSPIHVPALIPQRWVYPYQQFNGHDLLRLMIGIVGRWPQSFPHMPGFIEDIEDGSYVHLMELAKPAVGDQLFSEGMNLSVICQEIDPLTQVPKEDAGFPINPRVYDFARVEVEQRMALCRLWLGAEWEQRAQEPVRSDIPALVLRGEQDVVIPASWDTRAEKGLSNSFHLVFPQTGHGVMNSNSCAREVAAEFLLDPAIVPDAKCWN